MKSRLALCSLMICMGLAGLLAKPAPLTGQQLQVKARWASKDKVCAKVKKSKKTIELCNKWGIT